AKRIMLSFDEWNVWYLSRFQAEQAARPRQDWPVAPRIIEDRYSAADAVVVGDMLISLLRHADRVTAASQAQLVNVIAPLLTGPGGPAWRQTTFHPFARTAEAARGDVLRVEPVCPDYDTERHGTAPLVSATATRDPETGRVALFAVNRSTEEPVELEADVRALGGAHAARDRKSTR